MNGVGWVLWSRNVHKMAIIKLFDFFFARFVWPQSCLRMSGLAAATRVPRNQRKKNKLKIFIKHKNYLLQCKSRILEK
jgi:hypothetical protein